MKKKYTSLFLLGLLVGASITNLYLSNELNRLYIEVETLEHDLNRAKDRAAKLEEDLQAKEGEIKSPTVKDVNIVIDYEGEEFTALYLQEYCEEITKKLIGQTIDNLEPELIFQILDERIVKIEDNHYKLYVESLIISEVITYHVKGEYLTKEEEEENN